MPFEIVRNDITNMRVDAIVNTANPRPVIGSGVDAAVHAKAGPLMLAARKVIGTMNTGEACVTPGFKLPCKHVIHTVGPVWYDGGHGEAYLLRQCYDHSLRLALRHRCKSVAFPLISSGNYGFPKKLALDVAVESIREFLKDHEMHVYLVVFSKESLKLSGRLVDQVRSFIDDAYVQEREKAEYSFSVSQDFDYVREKLDLPAERFTEPETFPCAIESEPLPLEWELQDEDLDDSVMSNGEETFEEDDDEALFDREPGTWKCSKCATTNSGNFCYRCGSPNNIPRPRPVGSNIPLPSVAKLKKSAITPFNTGELCILVKKVDAGFSETLLKLIDESGEKDSVIYKRANVDRKLFSKIRNNPQYKPSKATALAFAIALELNLEETCDFIGRAGYALSRSNKFDIIIEYFITHGRYDIYEINMMLFEFDQSLLGA